MILIFLAKKQFVPATLEAFKIIVDVQYYVSGTLYNGLTFACFMK